MCEKTVIYFTTYRIQFIMDDNTQSIANQSILYQDTVVQFETVTLNDVEYLFLDQVQQRFRSVTCFSVDNVQLAFLRDENGNPLEPLRILARKNQTINALEPEEYSNRLANESINEMQKAIDHIQTDVNTLINHSKQVKTLTYELHEYTTPRYFYILPFEDPSLSPVAAIKNFYQSRFKLYFFCECSDNPRDFHTAPHSGYVIKKLNEFLSTYSTEIRTALRIFKMLINVGDSVVPKLADTTGIFRSNSCIPGLNRTDTEKAKKQLEDVEEALKQADTDLPTTEINADTKTPLQGAQLRELAAYLENADKNKALGNLHRMITDDGHVRWVCLEHYDTNSFKANIEKSIQGFEKLGGNYNRDSEEAVLNKSDKNLEKKDVEILCNLLTNRFKINALKLENCILIENDLNKLFDNIINRRSICRSILSSVIINPGLFPSNYTCKELCMDIKNRSLEIQLSNNCQNGDLNTVVQIWTQNKTYPLVIIRACKNFPKYDENFEPNSEKAMVVNHVNNLQFLCDILDKKLPLTYLKLNFCFGSLITLTNFCRLLKDNNGIVELDIMNYTGFDNDNIIPKLFDSLQNHKSLKQLSLLISNIQPTDSKESRLIKFLNDSNNKIELRLRLINANISKELALALTDTANRKTLICLEVYKHTMDKEGFSKLQSLLNTSSTKSTFSNEQYWCVVSKDIQQIFQKGN